MKKTTIKDLLATLDKSQSRGWIYIEAEDLAREFGVWAGSPSFPYQEDCALRAYRHQDASWVCTDTGVGLTFVFLNDEFVALVQQQARKDDSYWYWVSKEAFDKTRTWFEEEWRKEQELKPSFIEEDCDLSSWVEYAKEMNKK